MTNAIVPTTQSVEWTASQIAIDLLTGIEALDGITISHASVYEVSDDAEIITVSSHIVEALVKSVATQNRVYKVSVEVDLTSIIPVGGEQEMDVIYRAIDDAITHPDPTKFQLGDSLSYFVITDERQTSFNQLGDRLVHQRMYEFLIALR